MRHLGQEQHVPPDTSGPASLQLATGPAYPRLPEPPPHQHRLPDCLIRVELRLRALSDWGGRGQAAAGVSLSGLFRCRGSLASVRGRRRAAARWGQEGETSQSVPRPCRPAACRFWTLNEIALPIVPTGPRLPRSDYSGGGWSARNVACARAVMAATNIPIPETMYPIVKILPSVVWGARSP
jgi:hypothetical protein